MEAERVRVRCVGAVVRDGEGRLLLIRRGRPPALGTWSVPGGRVEPGESAPEAVAREVAEETGLRVEVGRVVGRVERDGPGGVVYVIDDYACRLVDGRPTPGDDAAAVGFFTDDELAGLDTAPGLLEALRAWGLLRRSSAG